MQWKVGKYGVEMGLKIITSLSPQGTSVIADTHQIEILVNLGTLKLIRLVFPFLLFKEKVPVNSHLLTMRRQILTRSCIRL